MNRLTHGFVELRRSNGMLGAISIVAVVISLVAFVGMPVLWMVLGAFKSAPELGEANPTFMPREWTIDSFRRLADSPFSTYVKNSLLVAASAAVLATAVGISAGYVLGRSEGIVSRAVGVTSLLAYMVSPIMLITPVYILFRWLGLVNTLPGLILAHCTFSLPFALWSLRAFFSSLPNDLEERGLLDGEAPRSVFVKIVMPLTAPALVTTFLFSFILSWNEYVYARVLTMNDDVKTVPVGLEDMFNSSLVDWGLILAAGGVLLVPAVLIVAVTYRHLCRGWLQTWQ